MANIDICGDDVLYKFDQFRSLQALVLHRAKIGSTDEEKNNKTQTFRESLTPFRKVYYLYIYINIDVCSDIVYPFVPCIVYIIPKMSRLCR